MAGERRPRRCRHRRRRFGTHPRFSRSRLDEITFNWNSSLNYASQFEASGARATLEHFSMVVVYETWNGIQHDSIVVILILIQDSIAEYRYVCVCVSHCARRGLARVLFRWCRLFQLDGIIFNRFCASLALFASERFRFLFAQLELRLKTMEWKRYICTTFAKHTHTHAHMRRLGPMNGFPSNAKCSPTQPPLATHTRALRQLTKWQQQMQQKQWGIVNATLWRGEYGGNECCGWIK